MNVIMNRVRRNGINYGNERARLFNQYHQTGEVFEIKDTGQFVRSVAPAIAAGHVGAIVEINKAPYFVNITQLKTAVF